MRCFLGNNVEYSVAFCLGHDMENFGRVLRRRGFFVFSLGGRLKYGFGGGVRVNDGRRNAVLVPAGAFAVDCVFEGVFVVIEAC